MGTAGGTAGGSVELSVTVGLGLPVTVDKISGKSSESVQCTITGPCLRMRHRPSA